MMVTPDGHSRLELSRFVQGTIADHRTAPVNSLDYLRVMFAVENIDELVTRLRGKYGAELVGGGTFLIILDARDSKVIKITHGK